METVAKAMVAYVATFLYLVCGVVLFVKYGYPWIRRDARWRPKMRTDGGILILYPTLVFFAHLVWPLTYFGILVTAAVKNFCCQLGYSCCGLSCAKKEVDDISADLEAANTSDSVTSQPPSYNESIEMGPVGKTSNAGVGL